MADTTALEPGIRLFNKWHLVNRWRVSIHNSDKNNELMPPGRSVGKYLVSILSAGEMG